MLMRVVPSPVGHRNSTRGIMSRNSMYRCGRSPRHACEPLERRRLLAGIALDLNYGADGRAVVNVNPSNGSYDSVGRGALLPDGRLLMIGTSELAASSDTELALVRLNADGTRDVSFGVDGVARFRDPVMRWSGGRHVILLPDGRFLAAGYARGDDYRPRLLRFFGNGRLDRSFGTDGVAALGVGAISSIARLADGKILA